MENEQAHHPTTHEHKTESSDATIYYVIGAIALVAIVGAGYLLRPKPAPAPAAPAISGQPAAQDQPTAGVPTPTRPTGPITKLACEFQYYNPVVGRPQYYLSAEGVDLNEAGNVNCDFKVSVNNKVVATDQVSTNLSTLSERGGQAFKCTTKGLTLEKNKPTKVDVILRDDLNASASCSSVFLLP